MIDVTLLGPALATAAEPVPEDEIRRRFELGTAQLVLTVSAKRPHKNLKRLIEAMAQLPDAVLVVPGYPTPFEAELRARGRRLTGGSRIRFTGWVDDATLEGLYRAATCFVFPSLAEGFGLPVLDALVRGVPVACSNASSIPGGRRRGRRVLRSGKHGGDRGRRRTAASGWRAPRPAREGGPGAGAALQLGEDGRGDARELRPRTGGLERCDQLSGAEAALQLRRVDRTLGQVAQCRAEIGRVAVRHNG